MNYNRPKVIDFLSTLDLGVVHSTDIATKQGELEAIRASIDAEKKHLEELNASIEIGRKQLEEINQSIEAGKKRIHKMK